MALQKLVATKKAQSALEFLTTYGWAFLVILIMIGALSYFGVLDPSRFLPDKCLFSIGIGACTDYGVTATHIQGVIVNNFGKDIVVNGINVTVSGVASACAPAADAVPMTIGSTYAATFTGGRSWASNVAGNFSIPCTIAVGERVLAKFTVHATPVGSTYYKVVTGEYSVRRS